MRVLIVLSLLMFSDLCFASDAKVVQANAEMTSAQKYNISVTIEHADKGWDHYTNVWRIYSPEGELIAERVLHHPHLKEQPFTRNLLGVSIPRELSEVIIVAVCSQIGESKKSYALKLH